MTPRSRQHIRRRGTGGMPPENPSRIASELEDLAVPIKHLHADPANVRTHGERNLRTIQASLRRFGQQKPIVVDRDGVVIAGNGVLAAARGLGWEHLAAVESELAGADRTAYAIADNRTAELAEWDPEALTKQLADLQNDEAFDELVAGFSAEEIERLTAPAGQPSGAESRQGPDVPECFQVVVECDSETHQRELYQRFAREGLKCRLLVL